VLRQWVMTASDRSPLYVGRRQRLKVQTLGSREHQIIQPVISASDRSSNLEWKNDSLIRVIIPSYSKRLSEPRQTVIPDADEIE
jgi:hypothetical protein